MADVKGEKRFSTQGREARKFTSKPFEEGDYTLKILGETFEVRKPEQKVDKDGKKLPTLPYINGAFEVLGTNEEGGRNRRVYHSFFLSQKPSDKDGSVMSDRADQIVGFARGLGEEIEGVSVIRVDGVDCIGPQALLKWIKAHDGATLDAHIKVSRERTDKTTGKTYAARNEVEFFIEAGEGAGGPDSDEEGSESEEESEETEDLTEDEESEETEEESTEEETEEEEEETEEEEEPAPAKKPVKKPAGKPVKKPLKKGKR